MSEVQQESPETISEEPSSEARVRPGTRGISSRVFFLLLAIGLLPLLALPFALWPLVDSAEALPTELKAQLKSIEDQHAAQVGLLEKERARSRKLAEDLASSKRKRRAETELAELSSRITPLCKEEKTEEELSKDKALQAALKSQQDLFTEVILLKADGSKAIISRSGKRLTDTAKAWTDLARAFKEGKSAPIPPAAGWTYRPLLDGRWALAAKLRAPIPDTQPRPGPQALKTDKAAAVVDKLPSAMAMTVRALLIALPSFSLLLALLGLWWWRRRFILPLQSLSSAAGRLLEEPETWEPDAEPSHGVLADLAASLERLAGRMRRLVELDEQGHELAAESLDLKILMERAGEGQVSLRAEVESGPLQELQLAFNRMLDRWNERAAGLGRQAQALGMAAGQMRDLLPPLDAAADSRDETRPAAAGLAELLGSQGLALCREAGALVDLLDGGQRKSAMPAEDILAEAEQAFRLLADRIAEAQSSLEQVKRLRSDSEVLATNLAISAEAESPTQLDKMVEDARALARESVEIHEQLSESIRWLDGSVGDLEERVRRVGEQQQRMRQALETGSSAEAQIAGLRQRIETVQPGMAELAEQVRAMDRRLQSLDDKQKSGASTLEALSTAAHRLTELAASLGRELQTWEGSARAPAAITRDLARQHGALTKAIERLQEVARAQGIEGLSPETGAILADIQRAANEARERILQTESKGSEG